MIAPAKIEPIKNAGLLLAPAIATPTMTPARTEKKKSAVETAAEGRMGGPYHAPPKNDLVAPLRGSELHAAYLRAAFSFFFSFFSFTDSFGLLFFFAFSCPLAM
jgi:hypothetical protein